MAITLYDTLHEESCDKPGSTTFVGNGFYGETIELINTIRYYYSSYVNLDTTFYRGFRLRNLIDECSKESCSENGFCGRGQYKPDVPENYFDPETERPAEYLEASDYSYAQKDSEKFIPTK